MTTHPHEPAGDLPAPDHATPADAPTDAPARGGPLAWTRLARPHQWTKSVFVLIGPAFALADGNIRDHSLIWAAIGAAGAFSLASSATYIVNDVLDAPQDRTHPRKRKRPVASGAISPRAALVGAAVLALLGVACLAAVPEPMRLWTGLAVLAYVANVLAYSLWLKHRVIADVVCLSMGFVLRVLGGCAAVGISPTTWLLNVTFFLAMFLAFGKRLGERRARGGEAAAAARKVQAGYTDDMLRLAVVVTGVVALVAYSGYVLAQDAKYTFGFNLLWVTLLPATYGLLRGIVLLERGTYDDPTEMVLRDRGFLAAAAVFGVCVAGLMLLRQAGLVGQLSTHYPP